MQKLPFFQPNRHKWSGAHQINPRSFKCGFCANKVSSHTGCKVEPIMQGTGDMGGIIYICPECQGPNFWTPGNEQLPAPAYGAPVPHVPKDLSDLYEEARRCTSSNCYTAAVLLSRKMLMNIAVTEGAQEGLKFIEYVEYLSANNFVPPKGKHWVDHVRRKGNEATHEIAVSTSDDAQDLVSFIEMLLRFNYEFPARVSSIVTPQKSP